MLVLVCYINITRILILYILSRVDVVVLVYILRVNGVMIVMIYCFSFCVHRNFCVHDVKMSRCQEECTSTVALPRYKLKCYFYFFALRILRVTCDVNIAAEQR